MHRRMANRPGRKSAKRARRLASKAGVERRYLLQFVGGIVLLGAFLMIFPAARTLYRWANRSSYVRAEVEVLTQYKRSLRSMRVRVLSSGEELSIHPGDFDELQVGDEVTQTQAAAGQRFSSWYNPKARARAGITLFDQRLVSARRFPALATGSEVLGSLAGTLALALLGGVLFTAPYRGSR
jgi:hypothetical protein